MSDVRQPSATESQLDVLCEFVTCGVEPGRITALLEAGVPRPLVDSFERAAAALDVALTPAHDAVAPPEVVARLKSLVNRGIALSEAPGRAPERRGVIGRIGFTPWILAAAGVALAAIAWWPASPNAMESVGAQLQAVLASEDSIRWSWTSTDDPAAQGGVGGEIVWSDELQQGFMRFSGLAVNDPTESQYQLWIFDADRRTGDLPQFGDGLLTQRPVDGGVFDISAEGEIIIPIDAKIAVGEAAAFAVTIERPGGVVVSDRGRVPVLALPS